MKYLLSFCLCLALFVSCGNSDNVAERAAEDVTAATQANAFQNMMDGHDRVMPLMNRITQAQRSIMEEMENTDISEERRELLIAVNEQLEDANDGMMEWMSNIQSLDDLREDEDEDDIMEYIESQTTAIAKVESNMKSSLAAADELFSTHDHSHADGDHDHEH